MKFINKVMVFVMGIVVIGIVTTTIGVVTQPKTVEKSVTFELVANGGFLVSNVFDEINEYVIFGNDNKATNVLDISINSDLNRFDTLLVRISSYGDEIVIEDGTDNDPKFTINSIDKVFLSSGVNSGDIIIITFSIDDAGISTFITTLLVLIPLILSASLIGYLVVKKGEE